MSGAGIKHFGILFLVYIVNLSPSSKTIPVYNLSDKRTQQKLKSCRPTTIYLYKFNIVYSHEDLKFLNLCFCLS